MAKAERREIGAWARACLLICALLPLVACSEQMSPSPTSRPALTAQSGFGKIRIKPNHITFSSVNSGPRHVRISQRGYSYGQFSYTSGGSFCQPNASGTFDNFNQRGEAVWSIYPTMQVAHGCPLRFLGAGNRKAKLFVTVK
jgi:hypothetical protein